MKKVVKEEMSNALLRMADQLVQSEDKREELEKKYEKDCTEKDARIKQLEERVQQLEYQLSAGISPSISPTMSPYKNGSFGKQLQQ